MSTNEQKLEDIERFAALHQNERDYNVIFEFVKEHANALAFHEETASAFFTVLARAPAAKAEAAMELCARYAPVMGNRNRAIGKAALLLLPRAPLSAPVFTAAANIAGNDYHSAPAILRILLKHAKDMPEPVEAVRLIGAAANSAESDTRTTWRQQSVMGAYYESAVYRGLGARWKARQLRRIARRAEKLQERFSAELDTPQPEYSAPRRTAARQLRRVLNRRFDGPI